MIRSALTVHNRYVSSPLAVKLKVCVFKWKREYTFDAVGVLLDLYFYLISLYLLYLSRYYI